ncbi:hypothetical protein GIW45_26905 [Pseudomonas congelans]|nr:hypothetical protein [Pseudomonas congelans]
MNGIIDEYEMFREKAPEAKVIAVRAGGGATATLPVPQSDPVMQALEESGDYFTLYNSVLGIDPNSERIFEN